MSQFNPLAYRCLDPIPPPSEPGDWQEHIPFVRTLVELLKPRVYVELGVATGAAYLAVCQALATLRLSCACYGVDTFADDARTGATGSDVEAALRTRHDATYGAFSKLLTATSEAAAQSLGDGSVDLLQLNGQPTYQAAAHDFATWLPKLSPRAVVLLSDIKSREHGAGGWRLWDELSARYPHFAFARGHNFGLLAVGSEIPPELAQLLVLDEETAERVAELFFVLGNRVSLQVLLGRYRKELDALTMKLQAVHATNHATSHATKVELERLRQSLLVSQSEREHQELAIAELRSQIRTINGSPSFRLGLAATAPLRWVAEKLSPDRGT